MKFILILSFLSFDIYASKLDGIFEKQTSIKDPFKLRDPFQAPKFRSEKSQRRKERIRGVWDTVPKPSDDLKVEDMQIKGVLIGKERRVMISTDGKNSFSLREGDTIGRTNSSIKAILPGGIILVEKITNIYGEDEFIETVVPISK